MDDVTAELVRAMLSYDPLTGEFMWRPVGNPGHASQGKPVGRVTRAGYHDIGLCRRRYFAHRLAWLYVHGVWPNGSIDHIDGNKLNNRISNLRDVTHAQNMQNTKRRTDNRVGFQGVTRTKSGKFLAAITIGTFATAEEASAAYLSAKAQMHSGYVA